MEKTKDRIKSNTIFRYLGLASLFFAIVQIAFGIVQVRVDSVRRIADLEQQVENTAKFLAAIKHKSAFQLDDATLENLLLKTNADTTIAYSLAIDANGNISSSFLNQQMPLIASAIKQETYLTLDATKIIESLEQNANIREVRTPILSVGQSLGEIRIGYSLENIHRETQQLTQKMLLTSTGISILLTAAIAILFDREVRSPLRALAGRATALSGQTISNNNEFEHLSEALDALEQKLQKLEYLKQHIVERKEVEKELEHLSHAKSQFLATISHEIRTPLNAIAGMTGLLLDTKLNEEQKEFTDIIRISGERLLTMINNILDFSKIEAKKLELEERPFDLAECIEESLRMFLPQAAPKNLELAYLSEPQTPTTIIGDATRVRQILSNLLSNAVKFTESGEVVVYVNATPIRSNQEDREQRYEIRFAVKDTGIGIPSAKVDRLFQSFSQVDASTTRKYGGTGLGLSISKQLCELMGGKMWVHSTEGMGSTFYFTIIARSAVSETSNDTSEARSDLVGKRMLIIDDNATNQKILTLQAQSWGMYTCAVESGVKALEWLERGVTFDIALLDMDLPNLDGVALAREIRKQPHCHNLPLVMLTSLNKQEIYQQSQENNFAAIVSKPIQQSQLYGILMQIFTGRPLKIVDSSLLPSSRKVLAQSLPLRILVAEDTLIDREVIRLLLEKLGYQADIVSNGLETLKFLRRQSYDVVLMDIQMPHMDGLAATRQICQEWSPQTRPRIIAMTAEAAPGDREKCLQAGMNDYIAKPIRIEELRKAIGQCRPLSPRAPIDVKILDSMLKVTDSFSPPINSRIKSYLQDIPIKLEAIATAIEDGNLETFQIATNALKTISVNLGANRLKQLCYELEAIDSYTNLQQASNKIPELEIEYEKVWQAWQRAFQQQNLESSKR
ncbi:MAG: response regulator [Hydrococcus sp. Prado102]|jgi:signal transduction histidine kinase/DNA-binding response OmpR family regulator|nr:response regulator [Hydrococcus sp. Prado102]